MLHRNSFIISDRSIFILRAGAKEKMLGWLKKSSPKGLCNDKIRYNAGWEIHKTPQKVNFQIGKKWP